MPEKSIKIIETTSIEDLLSDVDALKAVFKRDGVLVIRGGTSRSKIR